MTADKQQKRDGAWRGRRKPESSAPRPENIHRVSHPRKARGGIKARSTEGEFGKNWWARRWIHAMEQLMDGARLQRGQRYARLGQVLSINEGEGGMQARVQGSRPAPYKVLIKVKPLTDQQWEQVLDVLADQAIFTAQLLAGEMPINIEEAFSTARVSLFPSQPGDLTTSCSCPDWANPCKHVAATHYILADRFDEDPFLLLRLRGRSQEEILQALRQRRSGDAQPEAAAPELPVEEIIPLENNLARFWDIGPELTDFEVNIQDPAVPMPVLKRLGELDAAAPLSLQDELSSAFASIHQAAMLIAFSDLGNGAEEEKD